MLLSVNDVQDNPFFGGGQEDLQAMELLMQEDKQIEAEMIGNSKKKHLDEMKYMEKFEALKEQFANERAHYR